MVAKALEVFPPGWILGYDIGCSFHHTINASSLGPRFNEMKCCTCVNAFHGYSHNYLCQLKYHPLNIVGMGLQDLETMEHLFSASNQLATITRYATAYRRRVLIDIFCQQWDQEKYQNLATMLHNDYVQALSTIEKDGQELAEGLRVLNLTEEDLKTYYLDEQHHFENLGKETHEDLHAVAYVELLRQYRDISASVENASAQFNTLTADDYQPLQPSESYSSNLSSTRKAETQRRYLREKREQVLYELVQMECAMGIAEGDRWKPTDPPYLETLKYINEREYRQALESLHKLVIQRLYELHRMNLSQTGYKMRTHIAAALQKRSKAIQHAVKRYNNAAKSLDPPRPTLDWTKVSHYSFLDQFNILQDSRHSLFEKPWSKPVIRELMKTYRRVSAAKVEILHCNIAIRRLHTSIEDEERHFDSVLSRLKSQSSADYGPVKEYVVRRHRVNMALMTKISQTYALAGFSGDPTPGIRKGTSRSTFPETSSAAASSSAVPTSPSSHPHSLSTGEASSLNPGHYNDCNDKVAKVLADDISSDSSDSDEEDEDVANDSIDAMVDFISNISVHG
ncbi:hypothetical protein VKT23_012384 [Stygiomarasmius scandens]|uniref:Uncharacterized protein n=1 Tax=Marasmiellus scandens TaxID=2682957 RepID=A0ABR1J5X1_9AGAR